MFASRTRLVRLCATCAAAAVVAACGASAPSAPSSVAPAASIATSGNLSMASTLWNFRYSPGMPATPSPAETGWQFTFPTSNGVGYLTTLQRPPAASRSITAAISIETTGSPYFEYHTEPENVCDRPAAVRLFFQRRGDDFSGNGVYESYRWWSNPVAYDLGAGSVTLTGDLTDPSKWTNVRGHDGTGDNEALFRAALADLDNVGFTFGGGCFFGHGVYVTPGTGQATFKATQYVIE